MTSEAEGTVVLLSFSSDDPTATYECAVDGGAYSSCSSPFRAANLPAGSQAFRVRGRDQSANVDPTPATAQFFVAAPRPAPPSPSFAPPPPFMSPFPPEIPTSGFRVVGEPSGSAGAITVSVTTRLAGTLKISAAVKGAPGRPFARAERRLRAHGVGP